MMWIRKVVAFYDRNVVNLRGYKTIPGSTVEFFYLVPKIYKGKPITLKDGTKISKNDSICELHIVNTNLSQLDTDYGSLFKMLREELIHVARYLQQEENQDVQAIFGITLLHRLAKRAGFTIIDINNPIKRKLFSFGENILRGALSKDSSKQKKKKKKVEAKECWMSRSDILKLLE